MSESQPKKDSLTAYRLDMIEKRLEAHEKQTAIIIEKLDALRDPSAALLLKSQIEHIASTLDRLDSRLDFQEDEINKIKAWRAWTVGLTLPIVAFLTFLADDIKAAIFPK
jgi:hypothetical protein